MLHISTAKVRSVIQLLRKIEAIRSDIRHESTPYEDLEDLIRSLGPDEKVDLVALVMIGKGDFTEDEWDDCWNHAEDEEGEYELAEHLTETPTSGLMDEGLSLVGEMDEEEEEDEDDEDYEF